MDAPDYDQIHEAYQRGRTVEKFTGRLNAMMLVGLGAGFGLFVAALMHGKLSGMVLFAAGWLLGTMTGTVIQTWVDRSRTAGDSGGKEDKR